MTTAAFLDHTAPVPLDRPFTRAAAISAGVGSRRLAQWLRDGLLVSPLRGVLHAAQLADGLELRVQCVKLIAPPDAVITDRTAGWLHGAPMVLAPGDHHRVPELDVFQAPGHRLRRERVRSGERTFLPGELVDIEGVTVTSKLRTTCDLGMQLSRRQAYSAMCAMMKVADFDRDELVRMSSSRRFKGYRWVRQFRDLAPRVDDRFESPGECVLALHWQDAGGLPAYVPQYEVPGIAGSYFLDLAVPELGYAAEYDGVKWHGPAQQAHDAERRTFLQDMENGGWIIDVFVNTDVYGAAPMARQRLRTGITRARRGFGARAWRGQDRGA